MWLAGAATHKSRPCQADTLDQEVQNYPEAQQLITELAFDSTLASVIAVL